MRSVCLLRMPNYLLHDERLQPPLGILYLAGCLRENHVPVSICDLAAVPRELWSRLLPDAEIYGFSLTTGDMPIAKEMAVLIKTMRPDALLVAGGAHPSAMPGDTLNHDFDVAVVGPGGQPLVHLAQYGKTKDVIVARAPDHLVTLPMPAWDLLSDLVSYELVDKGEPATCVFTSMGCPMDCAFCLPPGEQINTDKGLVPIDKLNGHKVLSHEGGFEKYSEQYTHPYSGDLFTITPYYFEPFRLTAGHRIYALKRSALEKCGRKGVLCRGQLKICETCKDKPYLTYEPEQIESERLNPGDYLLVAFDRTVKDIPKLSMFNMLKNCRSYRGQARFKWSKNAVPSKIQVSPEFLRLCGYFLAEGHVGHHKDRPNSHHIVFTINKEERQFLEDIQRCVQASFGLEISVTPNESNHTLQITVGSNMVAALFEEMFGEDRHIPLWMKRLPMGKQIHLLRGVFHGDSHRSRSGYELTTVSSQLAQDIKDILLRFRVVPGVRRSREARTETIQGRPVNCRDAYKVWVHGPRIDLALKGEHPLITKRNRTYSFSLDTGKHLFIPIRRLSKSPYEGTVYNINVPGPHSYSINNIAVKNCAQDVWRHQYVERDLAQVEEELTYLKKTYGITEARLVDELTMADRRRFTQICEMFDHLGLKWRTHTRADLCVRNADLLFMAKDCGLVEMAVGVENPDDLVLLLNKKGVTVAQCEMAIQAIKYVGIRSKAYFIIGLPGESWDTVHYTMEWIRRVKPDRCTLSTFVPYPNCDIWRHPEEYKYRLLPGYDDWRRFFILGYEGTDEPFIGETEHMTNDDLVQARHMLHEFMVKEGYKDPAPEGDKDCR